MLFFGGAGLILLSLFMLVKFLVAANKPKAQVPVKEYVFAKIKSDLFGLGGNQKHARVTIDVNGVLHEADVLVGKSINIPIGENIRVSYSASNPKVARYYNPKKELLAVCTMFIIGSVLCAIALAVSSMFS